MDNRVTKKRIALHLEYDWLKYVLVFALSAFVFYMVFMQINVTREFEKVEVFFSQYAHGASTVGEEYLSKIREEGDDYIREVNINYQSPNNTEVYSQLFLAAGMTSDVLIIPKSVMDAYATSFVQLTDEVIEQCVPDELKNSVDYYIYSREGRDPEYVYEDGVGKPYGIRVDNLAKLAVENPEFVFNMKTINPEISDEDLSKYDSEFYIVVNRTSIKIGTQGKKEEYHGFTQSYRFVRFFLNKYGL